MTVAERVCVHVDGAESAGPLEAVASDDPPKPEDVRGLGRDLAALGFSAGESVSPEPRSWHSWPKELLRGALLPQAPQVAVGSTRAARDLSRLDVDQPEAGTLFRLLTVGEPVESARIRRFVPPSLCDRLAAAGIAVESGGEWRALFRVVPLHGAFLLSDFPRSRSVLGNAYVQLGLDSAMLADMILREGGSGTRALDLCTGGGVQALMLSRRYARVEGSDINPRAIAMARANAAMNGAEDGLQFRVADLYDGAEGQYDLIVANPPFIFLPDDVASTNLTGNGGEFGIQLTLRILEGLESRLSERGQAFVYTQAPRIAGACRLVQEASKRLASAPLHLEFEEMLRGYWSPFRGFYQRMGVEWITCYRLRVRRATALQVTVRPLTGWRRAALQLAVTMERWSPI